MTRSFLAGVCLLGAVAVSACGPQQGTGPAFQSFKNDPRGACFAERQELERQGTRFDTSFRSPAREASDVLGAAERYLTVLLSGERSFLDTLSLVSGDLERENLWVGWTSDAFDTLTACRKASALAINNSRKAGRISREQAAEQLAEVRAIYDQDTARFQQFADQIALNTATFAEVYTDFALITGTEPVEISPTPTSKPARKAPPRQTRLVRTAPKDSAAPAIRPVLAKLRTDLLTNTRKRDEVYQRIEQAREIDEALDLAGSPVSDRLYAQNEPELVIVVNL